MLISYIDNHDGYAVFYTTRWRLRNAPSAFLEVIMEEEHKARLQFMPLKKVKDIYKRQKHCKTRWERLIISQAALNNLQMTIKI